MSPKNILFITREIVPFHYGGIGTLFKALALLLSAKGHSISFLSQDHDNFDPEIFQQQYGAAKIHRVACRPPQDFPFFVCDVGKISSFQFSYNLAVAEEFDRIVAQSPPDMVISADFGAEAIFVLAKARLGLYPGIRFILHISGSLHNLISVYESGCADQGPSKLEDPENKLICAMEDGCLALAPEVIVPTRWTWEETLKRVQVDSTVHVIPNYPDKRIFSAPEKDEIPVEKHGLKLLFIGRLDRCKGADLLLKLFIDFHQELPAETELIFIGRDCGCKEYKATFMQHWSDLIPPACRDRIQFLGQVEHSRVKDYLQKAAVCIFPSRWEVFGLVCLEAMAHGVPVLVSKNTGPAEVIGPDLAQYVFDFENEQEQIIGAISALCTDPSGNAQLREQVRNRAAFLISQAEEQMEDLVLAPAPPPSTLSDNNRAIIGKALIGTSSAMGDIAYFLGKDPLKIEQEPPSPGKKRPAPPADTPPTKECAPEPPRDILHRIKRKLSKIFKG